MKFQAAYSSPAEARAAIYPSCRGVIIPAWCAATDEPCGTLCTLRACGARYTGPMDVIVLVSFSNVVLYCIVFFHILVCVYVTKYFLKLFFKIDDSILFYSGF